MTRLHFPTLVFLFFNPFFPVFAQKSYFQQEVNTTIRVSLDDEKHWLSGDIQIEYINNSPDKLSEIKIHCWANAYKSDRSAMARQFLRMGETKFHFALPDERGGFENLNFSVKNQKSRWYFDDDHPDIVHLKLAEPLLPGDTLHIFTPLLLRIPNSFSRLGHVGQSYQMTQWFPKPAVYDQRGWHEMPYLNMGEFYSEFGRYEVSITLPENYVVAATGVCRSTSEIEFLKQKLVETDSVLKKGISKEEMARDTFPKSSDKMKTVHFSAENVHDFAWFADKRFLAVRDEAKLSSGRTLPTWAFFTREGATVWQKGAFFTRRAVEFYSKNVGEYPYPHATAVHSALSAGGGMEYPMITVINNERTAEALDQVITHEVGHNWFYGILASDEREHPWLDEGLNSFYEQRYMRQFYSHDMAFEVPKFLHDPTKQGEINKIGCLTLARLGMDTPPDSHSDEFSMVGYGVQAYMKTAASLRWLEESAGKEKFDEAMHDYFEKWKFRHPAPQDFLAVLKENELNSDWFWENMATQKQADFVIKNVEKRSGEFSVKIKNKGRLNAPFQLAGLKKNGEVVVKDWYTPLKRTTIIRLPIEDSIARFVLDLDGFSLDYNRKNNFGKPWQRPLRLKMFAPFEEPRHAVIGALPFLAWNKYDKLMLGGVFYNPPLPGQDLQYYLAPALATGTGEVVGLADVRLRRVFQQHPQIRLATVGFSAKVFHFENGQGYDLRYSKIAPFAQLDFRMPAHLRFWTRGRIMRLGEQYLISAPNDGVFATGVEYVADLKFHFDKNSKPLPSESEANFEIRNQGDASSTDPYLRATAWHRQNWFFQKGKKLSARVFAGFFLNNNNADNPQVGFLATDGQVRGSFSLSQPGYADYRFDQVFFGRNQETGFLARQISESEGGFKHGFGFANAQFAGASNRAIFALNLKSDLPFRIPVVKNTVKTYVDFGFASRPSGVRAEEIFWSGGLALSFFQEHLNFYFPLVNSSNLRDLYKKSDGGSFFGRVSWSLDLSELEPVSLMTKLIR